LILEYAQYLLFGVIVVDLNEISEILYHTCTVCTCV
jgi:hypothetical protein